MRTIHKYFLNHSVTDKAIIVVLFLQNVQVVNLCSKLLLHYLLISIRIVYLKFACKKFNSAKVWAPDFLDSSTFPRRFGLFLRKFNKHCLTNPSKKKVYGSFLDNDILLLSIVISHTH